MADSEILQINTDNIEVIAPGLVVIKGGLSKQTQIYLTEFALKLGNNEDYGFFVTLRLLIFMFFQTCN